MVIGGPKRRGIVAYRLGAWGLTTMALVSLIPAAVEGRRQFAEGWSAGVPRWICLAVLLAVVQWALAVYLAQLPDRSTLRVVSFAALVQAGFYAALLGYFVAAPRGNTPFDWLELPAPGAGGEAALWCLLMLSLSGLLSYGTARASLRVSYRRGSS